MIAKGGFGEVYKGWDNTGIIKRQVAIKKIYKKYKGTNNSEKIKSEIEINEKLSHPNIVKYEVKISIKSGPL